MGTTYTVKVVSEKAPLPRHQRALENLVELQLESVDEKMSTYREDSELSRLNRWQDNEPFPLSVATYTVLRHAQEISGLTGGAFDVTVGPLVNAWGFGPGGERGPPADEEIERLRRHVGFQKLELDEVSRSARKRDSQLYLDLSAIAKGYAVDRVAEALEGEGWTNYMVEVGGEIRTGGSNASGRAWQIAVARPVAGARELHRVLPLSNLSLATSGDYRNYYELEGRRVSHEIDPRTGYPVRHRLASVSVLDPLCVRADGLATGLMVLGPEDGYALAEERDIPALFFIRERNEDVFREKASPALETWLGTAGRE